MTLRRILVVDDDPAVGATTCRLIGVAGYEPVYRNTPDAALAYLEQNSNGVAAVLTDLHMIGMDGARLAARINAEWPAIPVAICTGGSGPGPDALTQQPGVSGVLTKPIRLQRLNELFSTLAISNRSES
jgi:CheY-like chemotaxis protein